MIKRAQNVRTLQQAEERKKIPPKVIELFHAGVPLKLIGKAVGGRSGSFIHRILAEAGLSRTPNPPHNRKPPTGRYAHLK